MRSEGSPSPNEAYVRFVGVEKTYDGETLVVRDFDLDVERGEFLTLLGPSGSGKTTCLMMLAGFESVTRGEIVLDGRPINNAPPYKREIGVVFQNYALFPHMTVDENIAFPLAVRNIPRAEVEARTRRALDMVQLSGFGHRRPGQLSGGQQQRVAVARALVFEPKLVLMDEPLGALDKQMREQMQYEVKHLHERLGVTVVYVTHDQTEALTMSNRIAVMEHGAIQQLATPQDLYDRPENAFVARFIGENNRLLGTVREVSGQTCVVAVEGGEVRALAVNVEGVGSSSTLSLRPERVLIDPSPAACPNVFDAHVEELIYHGDHTRVRVRTCGCADFIIKLPNAAARVQLAEGEHIRVGWRVEDCRALDVL
jgi:putative spermidine/putrescine transport system ATP-binding protein